MIRHDGRFWRNHLLLPLLLFILLAGLLESGTLDIQLADLIYQAGGGGWTLQNSTLFSTILHDQAKMLVKLLAGLLFVLAILSQFIGRMRPYRRAIWYLALVMPLSGLLVGIGKEVTHVDCPWDLLRYGGEHPYIRLFEPDAGGFRYGKCFPAAHAGAGYTFLALYFFLAVARPEWRGYGLLSGLVLGLVFGLTQQLRGAHFLSHDLWTAAICWFNSLGWYWFAFGRKPRLAPASRGVANDPECASTESSASVATSEK
ncbi:phosphatase PAP2 family protein [Sedimenticola hydrogenitrophicus]|uniref:phosphatase PAP2 family protein n=1 Tax=Sedimenticola hydrogenitrophicus TaxID=2967975 RepID=UPI0021A2E0CD|nr:phosphatase PAP2 family protein [Sedimenticola hydrogenitrophicus]